MTSFADITTMGVGGPIAHFIEPTTRVGLIEAVEEADSKGLPLGRRRWRLQPACFR